MTTALTGEAMRRMDGAVTCACGWSGRATTGSPIRPARKDPGAEVKVWRTVCLLCQRARSTFRREPGCKSGCCATSPDGVGRGVLPLARSACGRLGFGLPSAASISSTRQNLIAGARRARRAPARSDPELPVGIRDEAIGGRRAVRDRVLFRRVRLEQAAALDVSTSSRRFLARRACWCR